MTIMLLMNPFTHKVAAELKPQQEVIIMDKWMLEKIQASGITVSRQFTRDHGMSDSSVYPPSFQATNFEKAIFAKAFQNFYFEHGLQQKGYFWKDKKVHQIQATLSDKELVEIVLGRKPCPWLPADS